MRETIKTVTRILRTSFRKSLLYPLYHGLHMRGYKNKIKGKKEIEINSLGNKLILPTSDRGLSRELMMGKEGVREREVLEMIELLKKEGNPLVEPNDNIIEVGANIGYYALQWAKIINKGKGKMYAIEPNPKTFEYLKKNIKMNKYKDIELVNKGISYKKDTLPFFVSKAWNISRFLEEFEKDKANKMVEVDSLDNMFKDIEINLIRMDVEGYEYQVLMGAKKILKKSDNLKILMEIHPNKLSIRQKKEMIELLRKNNFKIKKYTDKWARVRGEAPLSKLLEATESQHFLIEKRKQK